MGSSLVETQDVPTGHTRGTGDQRTGRTGHLPQSSSDPTPPYSSGGTGGPTGGHVQILYRVLSEREVEDYREEGELGCLDPTSTEGERTIETSRTGREQPKGNDKRVLKCQRSILRGGKRVNSNSRQRTVLFFVVGVNV